MSHEDRVESARTKVDLFARILDSTGYFCPRADIEIDREQYSSMLLLGISHLFVRGTEALSFYGGKGSGKTSLAEALGIFGGGYVIMYGGPDKGVEDFIGTLDFAELTANKREKPIWAGVAKEGPERVAILDEINRNSSKALSCIYPVLAHGKAEFRGHLAPIDRRIYFTENPKDEGTFDLPGPFRDRIAVRTPAYQVPNDKATLVQQRASLVAWLDEPNAPEHLKNNLKRLERVIDDISTFTGDKDLKRDLYSSKKEYSKVVKTMIQKVQLQEDEVKAVQEYLLGTPIDPMLNVKLTVLTKDLTLCEKAPKNDKTQLGSYDLNRLCPTCTYNNTTHLCRHTTTGVSARVNEILPYVAALEWLVGKDQMEIMQEVIRFFIWHRIDPNPTEFGKAPYQAVDLMGYTQKAVDESFKQTETVRKPKIKDATRLLESASDKQATLRAIESEWKNIDDLYLKLVVLPELKDQYRPKTDNPLAL